MITDLKTPQLRVCVTPSCNLSCAFCRPGGEGYDANLEDIMSFDEITKILEITNNVGFDCIKFTGGEPLIRRDISELLDKAREMEFNDIQMVTNGTLLLQHLDKIRNAELDMLTVSLDAIDDKIYKSVRGTSVVPVLRGISLARDAGIDVRINTVVTKETVNQIQKLIDFAYKEGCSLKLLDLIRFEGMEDEWASQYLHFNVVRQYLNDIGAVFVGNEEAPGGIGAPLFEYLYDDTLSILLKDSTRGTFYHESCKLCKKYPCQDALISVRVTHDGKLKRCLIRNDNMVDILTPIRMNDIKKAERLTKAVFKIMVNSSYYQYAWKCPLK